MARPPPAGYDVLLSYNPLLNLNIFLMMKSFSAGLSELFPWRLQPLEQ
jgi:hypothetical protein